MNYKYINISIDNTYFETFGLCSFDFRWIGTNIMHSTDNQKRKEGKKQ